MPENRENASITRKRRISIPINSPGSENRRRNAHRVSSGCQAAKWPLDRYEGPQSGNDYLTCISGGPVLLSLGSDLHFMRSPTSGLWVDA